MCNGTAMRLIGAGNASSYKAMNATMTRWWDCFGAAVKLSRSIGKHVPPPPSADKDDNHTMNHTKPEEEEPRRMQQESTLLPIHVPAAAATVPQLFAEIAVFVDDHSILQWPGGRTASFSESVLSDPQLMLSTTLGAQQYSS